MGDLFMFPTLAPLIKHMLKHCRASHTETFQAIIGNFTFPSTKAKFLTPPTRHVNGSGELQDFFFNTLFRFILTITLHGQWITFTYL